MVRGLFRKLVSRRAIWCVAALVATAVSGYVIFTLYRRPMFCEEHEGHFGPQGLQPLWEVIRPIRDHSGPIAFTDSELNLMIVFVSDGHDGSEPWPNRRSWFYAKFDLPNGDAIRIWRQHDRLLVVDKAGTVVGIGIDEGSVKRIREALFNLARDRKLLEELGRMLNESEAAQLRAVAAQ